MAKYKIGLSYTKLSTDLDVINHGGRKYLVLHQHGDEGVSGVDIAHQHAAVFGEDLLQALVHGVWRGRDS